METVKLSSKGQVVIPKALRERHRWDAGTELSIRDTGRGVALEPVSTGKALTADQVAGCLKHVGRTVSIRTMNRVAEIALRDQR